MPYEIALDAYKGPLDKLLELVEGRELQITQISLAEVTADFLKYVESLGKKIQEVESGGAISAIEPSILADFLVVASKLILIKSKTLIPTLPLTEEEATDIKDLELRLKLYKELKSSERLIKENWSLTPKSFTREFLVGMGPVFYPPYALKKEDFINSLQKLIITLEKTLKPLKTFRIEAINLKKKIEEILHRLSSSPTSFHKLKNKGTKEEIVVMFLAILHLIKDQLISVDQDSHFNDMKIAKRANPA